MNNFSKPKLTTVLAGAALFLASCDNHKNQQVELCADNNGWRVNDENCRQQNNYGGGAVNGGHHVYVPYYSSSIPRVGEKIVGGSATPISGRSIVSRGGWGSH